MSRQDDISRQVPRHIRDAAAAADRKGARGEDLDEADRQDIAAWYDRYAEEAARLRRRRAR